MSGGAVQQKKLQNKRKQCQNRFNPHFLQMKVFMGAFKDVTLLALLGELKLWSCHPLNNKMMVHKFSILRLKVKLLMQGNSPLTKGFDKFKAKTSLEAELAYPYTACHFHDILSYRNNCMIPRYSSTELFEHDNYGYPLCTHPHQNTKNHHHRSRNGNCMYKSHRCFCSLHSWNNADHYCTRLYRGNFSRRLGIPQCTYS